MRKGVQVTKKEKVTSSKVNTNKDNQVAKELINHQSKKSTYFDEYLSKQIERVNDSQIQSFQSDEDNIQRTSGRSGQYQEFGNSSQQDKIRQLEEQLLKQDRDHKEKFHIVIGLNEHLQKQIEAYVANQLQQSKGRQRQIVTSPTRQIVDQFVKSSRSNHNRNESSTSPYSWSPKQSVKQKTISCQTDDETYGSPVQIVLDHAIIRIQAIEQQRLQYNDVISNQGKSSPKLRIQTEQTIIACPTPSHEPKSKSISIAQTSLEFEIDQISRDLRIKLDGAPIEKLRRIKQVIIEQELQFKQFQKIQNQVKKVSSSKANDEENLHEITKQMSLLRDHLVLAYRGQQDTILSRSTDTTVKQKSQDYLAQINSLIDEMNSILKTSVVLDTNVFKKRFDIIDSPSDPLNEQIFLLQEKLLQKKVLNGQLKQRVIDLETEKIKIHSSRDTKDDGPFQQIEEFKLKCKNQENQINSLNQTIMKLQKELEEFRLDQSDVKLKNSEVFSQKIEEFKQKCSNQEHQINSLNSTILKLKKDLDQVRADQSDTKQKDNIHNKQIEEFQKKSLNQENKINSLTQTITKLQIELDNVRVDNQNVNKKQNEVTSQQIDGYKQYCLDQENQIKQLNQTIIKLQKDSDQVRADQSDVNKKQDKVSSQYNEELKQKSIDQENKINMLTQTNLKIQIDSDQVRANYSDLSKKQDISSQQIDEYKSKCIDQDNQLNLLRQTNLQVLGELVQIRADNQSVNQKQNDVSSQQINELNQQSSIQNNQINKLTQTNQKIQGELDQFIMDQQNVSKEQGKESSVSINEFKQKCLDLENQMNTNLEDHQNVIRRHGEESSQQIEEFKQKLINQDNEINSLTLKNVKVQGELDKFRMDQQDASKNQDNESSQQHQIDEFKQKCINQDNLINDLTNTNLKLQEELESFSKERQDSKKHDEEYSQHVKELQLKCQDFQNIINTLNETNIKVQGELDQKCLNLENQINTQTKTNCELQNQLDQNRLDQQDQNKQQSQTIQQDSSQASQLEIQKQAIDYQLLKSEQLVLQEQNQVQVQEIESQILLHKELKTLSDNQADMIQQLSECEQNQKNNALLIAQSNDLELKEIQKAHDDTIIQIRQDQENQLVSLQRQMVEAVKQINESNDRTVKQLKSDSIELQSKIEDQQQQIAENDKETLHITEISKKKESINLEQKKYYKLQIEELNEQHLEKEAQIFELESQISLLEEKLKMNNKPQQAKNKPSEEKPSEEKQNEEIEILKFEILDQNDIIALQIKHMTAWKEDIKKLEEKNQLMETFENVQWYNKYEESNDLYALLASQYQQLESVVEGYIQELEESQKQQQLLKLEITRKQDVIRKDDSDSEDFAQIQKNHKKNRLPSIMVTNCQAQQK